MTSVVIHSSLAFMLLYCIFIIYGKQVTCKQMMSYISQVYLLSLCCGYTPNTKGADTSLILSRMKWAALCSNMTFTRKGYIFLHRCIFGGSILWRAWIYASLRLSLIQLVTPSIFLFTCGKWAQVLWGALLAARLTATRSDFHITLWLICM